ncbi:MAG: CPBP family intramembrane metalloprotease [Candidatus Atribacteria bacterium]|nr:CPBP family intramembrane metalloprotease [Candidatus Atribacteria bacterium]
MNERLRFFIPYIAFVGTALIVLLLDFGWVIPLSKKDGALYDYFPQGIYIMPILWLVIMCFPIAYIIFYEDKLFDLPEEPPERKLSTFIIAFTGLFCLIMLFRTMIIWRYNGPYEKMSMIFFLLLQILLVEQISLTHYGLVARAPWEEWKRDLKYIGYLMLIAIILLLPTIIIAIIIFYPQLNMIIPQMIPPNGFLLISFPFQTIAVGISEELMFRGYIYENIKEHDPNYDKKSHMYFWILFNSFIFGCFHIPWYIEPGWVIPPENYYPMISRIISTGAFGIFMCLIYEYTGSLRITILIHGLWNTLGAFLGSMFLYIDFDILNTITNDQFQIFVFSAAIPLLIAVIIGLKTPRYLANKLKL